MKSILFCLVALATACVAQDNGHVENFVVSDFGNGFITLSWDFVEGTNELHKYSLVIDSDLTSEFRCTAAQCTKTVNDLESCVEHVFDLTPIFYDSTGADVNGDAASTSGYTEDEIPGAVSDIAMPVDTDAETRLTWSKPSENPKCVAYYNVCFRLDGETSRDCVQSSTTEVSVVGVSACGNYHVEVTPVTPSNKQGQTTEEVFKTHDGVPGEPQDVVVGLITQDTIQLLWNNPTDNFLCLDRFFITIGEGHAVMVKRTGKKGVSGYDNEFTFTPLYPCTDYIIDVCSANTAEETSAKVVRYASTDETDPLPPTSVTVTPNGPDSIEVSWGENENDRCAGGFEVCWSDGVHPIEQCEEVGGDGDNSLTIYDLVPCSEYDFIVTVVSPNGTFSSTGVSNSTSTADVRPDPVRDLKFKSIDTNQLTISYQLPEKDPQCVKEIVTRITDDNQRLRRKKAVKSAFEETFTGLASCTDYTVQVSTVSPTGLESVVEEVSEKTLSDLPSVPQEFEAVASTTTSVTVQWFQPAVNPRCVTDYLLSWINPDNVADNATVSASTFKVVYNVEDLTPCTVYDFVLSADSLSGESSETTFQNTTLC